ncbi:hypothetical protein RHSIM_Rhsim11G0018200 [Rhododendron simsii]|uniref:PRP1 splicing factor N-terminal domain-containing protein n=1 Tax=Rhododendron simsii TaxID=118357 RepID=A0A834LAK6_RHOSS|nr:hypothetical protein RHSIM_Rhsim11G0018200 [Rhododendron simsii]
MVPVISMDNETLTLDLDLTTTSLDSLHLAIERESGVPASHQRLFFSFRQLIGTGLAGVGCGRGKGPSGEEEEEEEEEENEKAYDENQKFDKFEGNDVGLFAWTKYAEEADVVREEMDKRMDSRRKIVAGDRKVSGVEP